MCQVFFLKEDQQNAWGIEKHICLLDLFCFSFLRARHRFVVVFRFGTTNPTPCDRAKELLRELLSDCNSDSEPHQAESCEDRRQRSQKVVLFKGFFGLKKKQSFNVVWSLCVTSDGNWLVLSVVKILFCHGETCLKHWQAATELVERLLLYHHKEGMTDDLITEDMMWSSSGLKEFQWTFIFIVIILMAERSHERNLTCESFMVTCFDKTTKNLWTQFGLGSKSKALGTTGFGRFYLLPNRFSKSFFLKVLVSGIWTPIAIWVRLQDILLPLLHFCRQHLEIEAESFSWPVMWCG